MNRPRRDLQLLSVTVERADGAAHEARAELWRRGSTETSGEKYVGTASEREPRHAVANAVLVALRRAYTGSRADRLELVSVDAIEALGGVPIVSVVLGGITLTTDVNVMLGNGGQIVIEREIETFPVTADATVRTEILFDLNSELWVTQDNVDQGQASEEEVESAGRAETRTRSRDNVQ